jgi:polyhydroxybutyrate depolymerase
MRLLGEAASRGRGYPWRMPIRWLAIVGMLLVVAGCGFGRAESGGYGAGVSVHSVGDRSYRLYVPAGATSPAPVVVMLHGGFGSAQQAERAYGWDQLADGAKFVVVYPDGEARAWNTNGGCCGRPSRDGVDDVGFITAAVEDVAANLAVDRSRIYATGMSNGGIMAYTLACHSGMFAAIGPVAATQLDPCGAPHPTSVRQIHGTDDTRVRFDGGRGEGVAHINGPAVPEVDAFWRRVDGCAAPTVNAAGSTASCADGRAVELATVAGGGHDWPAFATQSLWEFFAAHPH